LIGLGDAAGGGEGGEALVQDGGVDAAARAQFGERRGAINVGKSSSDALVESGGAGAAESGGSTTSKPNRGAALCRCRSWRSPPFHGGQREHHYGDKEQSDHNQPLYRSIVLIRIPPGHKLDPVREYWSS
jgi:hypothetical protein